MAAAVSFFLAACSGVPSATFTIGGSVSGLSGAGLVLQNNGRDNLSVSANGTFTFPTPVTTGGAYAVTVLTQPSNPAQNCVVTNGSGMATPNVTSVQVACTNTGHTIGGMVVNLAGAGGGLQLHDNGGDTPPVNANESFTFPTAIAEGSAYAVTVSRQPTTPAQTCGVTNGTGTATANVTNIIVDCGHNERAWMGGSNLIDQAGTYGTLGTPAAANVPGARVAPITWTDPAGNLWLFGGYGYDSAGNASDLSDLWEYRAGQWTWIGASNLAGLVGKCGILGLLGPANLPGARDSGMSWIDQAGNLWLFGGYGFPAAGASDYLNDLWKYEP